MLRTHKELIWTPAFGGLHGKLYQKSFKVIRKVNGSNLNLKFIIEDSHHFRAVQTFWNSYNLNKLMSSGFYFVNCALALCQRVTIFGFWPFRESADGRPLAYHYFDKIPWKKAHDMSLEFKILVAMHHHGLLQLHSGNCTNETWIFSWKHFVSLKKGKIHSLQVCRSRNGMWYSIFILVQV